MSNPTKSPQEGTPEYDEFLRALKKEGVIRVFIEDAPGSGNFSEVLMVDAIMCAEVVELKSSDSGPRLVHSRFMWLTAWSFREDLLQLLQWLGRKFPRAVMQCRERSDLVMAEPEEVAKFGKKG